MKNVNSETAFEKNLAESPKCTFLDPKIGIFGILVHSQKYFVLCTKCPCQYTNISMTCQRMCS